MRNKENEGNTSLNGWLELGKDSVVTCLQAAFSAAGPWKSQPWIGRCCSCSADGPAGAFEKIAECISKIFFSLLVYIGNFHKKLYCGQRNEEFVIVIRFLDMAFF